MHEEAMYLHFLNILLQPAALRRALGLGIDAPVLWEVLDADILRRTRITGKRIPQILKAREKIDSTLEMKRLEKYGLRVIFPGHPLYPPSLLEIPDKPEILYLKSDLPDSALLKLWREKMIAIVGPRFPSPYGAEILDIFAPPLANAGIHIVSGLATGIDSLAHRAALASHTPTIAVLGNGLDGAIYPAENARLASEIAKTGALLTEYPPGTEPKRYHFPERNRIIAGLSAGTLLIEAGERSGGLITAMLALDYNREVFVIPANITKLQSKGSNALLKQGAHPVTGPSDIFEILGWKRPQPKELHLNAQEAAVIAQFKRRRSSLNELLEKTKLHPAELAMILLHLELRGVVTNPANGVYEVN